MMGLVAQAPLLPFIPSPYPDEVLGSWLSRIRLENGGGAWRPFLEHIGYGRRLQTVFFDAVDHNEKLSLMLTLLGTSYERALLELSTLPYWLTFSASDSSSRLPGTETIPALRRMAGAEGEVTSIKNLGLQRVRGRSFEPRYCRKCILQDWEEVGQAYWHRAHQLPNVLFCNKHHCGLQVKCPRCGAKPGGQISKVLPLPTLKCRCGFRLDTVTDLRILSAQELRLITLSVRALSQGLPSWRREDVLSFLHVLLAQGVSSPRGRYQRILEEAFPGRTMKWSDRGGAGYEQTELLFRRYLCCSSAPECCALLAALDIDLDTAIEGFTAAVSEVPNCESRAETNAEIMTVENSRSAICLAHKLYPTRCISYFRRHYWYLQLYDAAWLKEHFPWCHSAPIPTIGEDRSELKKILSSVQQLGHNPFRLARRCPAGLRAMFRDKNWFNEQKTYLRQKMAVARIGANNAVLLTRAACLQGALDKLVASEERPIRIFASTLGALVGLSDYQAASTVKSAPELRKAIAAANAGKLRRQLLWAARQLNLSGGRLTKQQLGRVAGVPGAAVSDEIFSEIKTLHYCKTPRLVVISK